ncbi:Gfo/Idh/MocA family protein [candidate division KSB1 bacterium]
MGAEKPVNILQIGYGYWGPNLARNLSGIPGTRIGALCEVAPKNTDKFTSNFPDAEVFKDYRKALLIDDIHAVVISTPAAMHYEMTRSALEAGKHVLVEKPLSLTSAESKILVDIAAKNNLILMVGHTFLYNSAVRKVKEYINNGEIGDIYYLYSHRLNLGKVRSDINSLWNFAPHDVSIILYLLEGRKAIGVTAKGFSYIQKGIEDVVFFTIEFENSVCAHVHVSWIDPNKVRKMTIVGSKKMIVYDDVSNNAKITLYDKGVDKQYVNRELKGFDTYGEFQLMLRAGDVLVPQFDFVEPLKVECNHFIECIRHNKRPITDGVHGFEVVRILETAQKSIKNNGQVVEIDR